MSRECSPKLGRLSRRNFKNMNSENRISFYRSPIGKHPTPEREPVSLEWVYNYLRNNEGAKKKTNGLRELNKAGGNGREYKKQNLESVTFGGIFDYRNTTDQEKLQRLNKKGLLSPSRYVTIDIDHLSLLGPGKLEELREKFVQDKDLGLRLIFVSPGGDGLKLVCESVWVEDPESYKIDYFSLLGYLHERYSISYFVRKGEDYIQILDATPDITRSCYLCHDSGVLLLDDNSPLYDSDEHIFPEVEVLEDMRKEKGEEVSLLRLRPEIVSSLDWRSFVEDRLLPACFDRIDQIFPSMDFQRAGGAWKSPYKLDGSPAKNKRRDKTVITQRRPDRLLEQGGGNIGLIDYFMTCNHITDFSEARKELSRICGLEQEEEDLRRKTAQSLNGAGREPRKRETGESPTGGDKPLQEADFSTWIELPKEARILEDIATEPEGFKTPYLFGQEGDTDKEPLIIPSEGVTLICGLSSHFKSTLLRNIALQMAEDPKEGDILFFSLEESVRKTKLRFLSTLADAPIKGVKKYAKSKNLGDIFVPIYRTNFKEEFSGALRNLESWITSGRLRIYSSPEETPLLLSLLDQYAEKRRIKAVFIDFIQRLKSGRRTASRLDEMRLIAEDLQNYTKKAGVPVIVAAQLNRATSAPDRMGSNNIAESADLTRYAETILCLWSSNKAEDITDKDFIGSKREGRLSSDNMGFKLGEPGTIYAKITKNKEGDSSEAVLKVNGPSGRIYPSEKEERKTGNKQEMELW